MKVLSNVFLGLGLLAILSGCAVTADSADSTDKMMEMKSPEMMEMESPKMMEMGSPTMMVMPGESVIDKWDYIHAPEAPMLDAVAVDASKTALLVLDVEQRTVPSRPRAVAMVPHIMKMIGWARKNDMLVVYSTTPGVKASTILPEVMPMPGEVVVAASVDKYYGTSLEETLRMHGITNVIITGVAAEGAVLGTTIGSVVRGFKVVLPVDCMASSSPFYEKYVVIHVLNAPGTSGNVTVTKSSMITTKMIM